LVLNPLYFVAFPLVSYFFSYFFKEIRKEIPEKDIRYTKGNSSSTVEHSIVVGDTSVRFCGFALLLL
jgi:hypothetical protein